MENNEELEYSCSECKAAVSADDKTCPNCGADLTEESYPSRFNKTWHRVVFYFIVQPLVYYTTMLIILLLSLLFSEAAELFAGAKDLSQGAIGLWVVYVNIFVASYLFSFLFIEKDRKTKLIAGSALAFSNSLITGSILFWDLNTSGVTIFIILFAEIAYNIFSKPNYKIFIPVLVLLFVWIIKFRIGDLPDEHVHKDFKRIVKEENLQYEEYFPLSTFNDTNYDKSVEFCVLSKTDTIILTLNYNKIDDSFFDSPHWRIVNWKKEKWNFYLQE